MIGLVIGALPLGTLEFFETGADRFEPVTVPTYSNPVLLLDLNINPGVVQTARSPAVLGAQPIGILPDPIQSAVSTLRFSDNDYTSGPGDSPANTHFEPRLRPLALDERLPLDPTADRRSPVAVAELQLVNRDRAFDDLPLTFGVDRQTARIRLLKSRSDDLDTAEVLWEGLGVGWQAAEDVLRLAVTDQSYRVSGVLHGFYGGTGGADGPADLKGTAIPQAYGLVRNVKPVQVNQGLQIYQLHDREIDGVTAVRVRGVALAAGPVLGSYTALAAATVAAGTYQAAISADGSYIRIGSAVDGVVTCDLRGDARDGYVSTIPALMRRILGRSVMPVELAEDSFAALDLVYPGASGIYLPGVATVADTVNRLAKSCLLWWGDTSKGTIGCGVVSAPQPGLGILIELDGKMPQPVDLPASVAPCIWRARVSYRPNWSPLSESDVAGAVLAGSDWTFLSGENSIASQVDTARLVRHAGAVDFGADQPHETFFDNEVDASSVATRLMTLFDVGRSMWQLPMDFSGYAVRRGDTIIAKARHRAFSQGKSLVVIGRSIRGKAVDLLAFG